jgi:uncharacterized membrane protein YeaQ/YmgE (transglycosylase-associated protein family)
MHVNDVLSAILVGIVVGILGRLILPGRQRIGAFVTVIIGIGSALLGAYVAQLVHVADKAPASVWKLHWNWYELGIQVGFAVIATAIAAAISHTRVASDARPATKRTRARRS